MKDWRFSAACAGTKPDLFYPEIGRHALRAKRICERCPVKDQCLDDALNHELPGNRYGIWGGLSAYERQVKFDGRKPVGRRPRVQPVVVEQTHCVNGHEWNDENTYHSNGRKYCRPCSRRRVIEYRQRRAS